MELVLIIALAALAFDLVLAGFLLVLWVYVKRQDSEESQAKLRWIAGRASSLDRIARIVSTPRSIATSQTIRNAAEHGYRLSPNVARRINLMYDALSQLEDDVRVRAYLEMHQAELFGRTNRELARNLQRTVGTFTSI